MNNLELWNAVKTTDPEHTSQVNQRGGYTSIDSQYQIMKATEQFGAYGSGWGFETIDFDFSMIEATSLVLVKAIFFYVQDGKRSTFPINNSWPIKSGSRVDNDFAKKAETNTMSKALSKLGFSADIFMGQFDNPDYVSLINDEFALEKAEDKIEEAAKQEAEHQEWVDSVKQTLSTAVTENELKKVFTGAVRKANLRQDAAAVRQFTDAKDKRKQELEK